jgi:hypothetical protein
VRVQLFNLVTRDVIAVLRLSRAAWPRSRALAATVVVALSVVLTASFAQSAVAAAGVSSARTRGGSTTPVRLSAAQIREVDKAWETVVDAEYDGEWIQSGADSRDSLCRALATHARDVYTKRFVGRSSVRCGALFDSAVKVAWKGFSSFGTQAYFAKVEATVVRGRPVRFKGHLFVSVAPIGGWLTSTWFVWLDDRWQDDSMPPLIPGAR